MMRPWCSQFLSECEERGGAWHVCVGSDSLSYNSNKEGGADPCLPTFTAFLHPDCTLESPGEPLKYQFLTSELLNQNLWG